MEAMRARLPEAAQRPRYGRMGEQFVGLAGQRSPKQPQSVAAYGARVLPAAESSYSVTTKVAPFRRPTRNRRQAADHDDI